MLLSDAAGGRWPWFVLGAGILTILYIAVGSIAIVLYLRKNSNGSSTMIQHHFYYITYQVTTTLIYTNILNT